MWRVQITKSIAEIRFVLKPSADHHLVWHYVKNKVPDLKVLNPNTFFHTTEIPDKFETESMIHFIFGDEENTEHDIPSAGLTSEGFEALLKEKIAFGLTLSRQIPDNNDDRDMPMEVVEAHKYIKYMDDAF